MKPSSIYRVCSGLLGASALSHAVGLLRHGRRGPELEAVIASMRGTHFDVMGSSRTLWDFYFGFSLMLAVSLLFLAVLAAQLARLVSTSGSVTRALGWSLAGCLAVVAVVGWSCFYAGPAIVSSVAAGCAGLAAWRTG